MAEINEQQLLELAKKAAIEGGAKIMEVYQSEFEVVEKEDQSPLTIADQRSNEVIEKLLKPSGIPILGVIYVPVKKWMYFGSSAGSYREVGDSREKLPLNIK